MTSTLASCPGIELASVTHYQTARHIILIFGLVAQTCTDILLKNVRKPPRSSRYEQGQPQF